MSTIPNAPDAAQGIFAPSGFDRLRGTLARWWVAYMTWRIEQAAIIQLQSMGDRDLKDIGLTRSSITPAVRFQPLLLS